MTVVLRLASIMEMHAFSEMCSSRPDSSVSYCASFLTSISPRCNQNSWWPVPEGLKMRARPAWARSKASLEDTQPYLSHLCNLRQRCSCQKCHIWPAACYKTCLPFSQKDNRPQKRLLQFTCPEADCESGEHIPGGTDTMDGSNFILILKNPKIN